MLKTPWDTFVAQVTSQSSRRRCGCSLQTSAATTGLCKVLLRRWPWSFAARRPAPTSVAGAAAFALPPVVGGLALLYTFGKLGILGQPMREAGIDIAFTTTAVILAQTFVALLFLVISVEGALRSGAPGMRRWLRRSGLRPRGCCGR